MPREKTSRSRSLNSNLTEARRAKKDEFYTQLADIENELRHYREHFRGKRVFCNCDDPYESNFFRYFALNFNALGLKELTIREVSYCAGNGAIDFSVVGKAVRETQKPSKPSPRSRRAA